MSTDGWIDECTKCFYTHGLVNCRSCPHSHGMYSDNQTVANDEMKK